MSNLVGSQDCFILRSKNTGQSANKRRPRLEFGWITSLALNNWIELTESVSSKESANSGNIDGFWRISHSAHLKMRLTWFMKPLKSRRLPSKFSGSDTRDFLDEVAATTVLVGLLCWDFFIRWTSSCDLVISVRRRCSSAMIWSGSASFILDSLLWRLGLVRACYSD